MEVLKLGKYKKKTKIQYFLFKVLDIKYHFRYYKIIPRGWWNW